MFLFNLALTSFVASESWRPEIPEIALRPDFRRDSSYFSAKFTSWITYIGVPSHNFLPIESFCNVSATVFRIPSEVSEADFAKTSS